LISASSRLDGFRALRASGLGVLDVGARGGAPPALTEIAPLVDLVGFEPDAEECARLNAAPRTAGFRSVRHLPVALGREHGARTLHLCRSRGASSLYAPRRAFLDRFPDASRFDVVETRTVETEPLDALRRADASALPAYVGFVKVDTQGSELAILTGARDLLREVAAVEVEVEFAGLYESQPVFRDVDRFLAESGFSLFKLRRMHWVRRGGEVPAHRASGQLVFGDALYLRDPLPGGAAPAAADARQAETLILLASLFDCHDFALELTADPRVAALIDAPAARRFVLARTRRARLSGLWKRRADRRGLFAWLHGYHREWGRGDLDFYSRV
jgi:FkbM family methyltransferase